MKKFNRGDVGMFAIRDFIKLFLVALLGLFLQIVPAYAAIQTESLHMIDETNEIVQTGETLIETIHAPPRIILSTENDMTVETFYPEEISFDEIETNYIEEIIYTPLNLSPRITTSLEDDIVVETFYPSEEVLQITEKKTPPSETQDLDDVPAKFSIISLSLDGTNSVQYFEQGEPYVASLNFIVGKTNLSNGIVFGAEYHQFL